MSGVLYTGGHSYLSIMRSTALEAEINAKSKAEMSRKIETLSNPEKNTLILQHPLPLPLSPHPNTLPSQSFPLFFLTKQPKSTSPAKCPVKLGELMKP
jgi:hypothetical protein